ncbi:GNAT family N-acetyltransferase [Roseateles sp.]|uniref:GNAT family N-acetyltransferase n=1 Tax=Roseateles sp. TaxID=1971397 RepID=UPI003BA7493F
MSIEYKTAPPDLAAKYIELRGQTRENAITPDVLRSIGITAESWARDIKTGQTRGFIALSGAQVVGYGFGDTNTGEVLVLVVHPAYEGQGVGRRLLALLVETLKGYGHARLFLGCSPDPSVRSHGFYRRLGWKSTGALDAHGDEVLALVE